jgi:hypothetical protein
MWNTQGISVVVFTVTFFFTNGVCKGVELSISVGFFACTYFAGGKRAQAVIKFHPMVPPMIFVFSFNVQDPNPALEIKDATQDFISAHHVTVSGNQFMNGKVHFRVVLVACTSMPGPRAPLQNL